MTKPIWPYWQCFRLLCWIFMVNLSLFQVNVCVSMVLQTEASQASSNSGNLCNDHLKKLLVFNNWSALDTLMSRNWSYQFSYHYHLVSQLMTSMSFSYTIPLPSSFTQDTCYKHIIFSSKLITHVIYYLSVDNLIEFLSDMSILFLITVLMD